MDKRLDYYFFFQILSSKSPIIINVTHVIEEPTERIMGNWECFISFLEIGY